MSDPGGQDIVQLVDSDHRGIAALADHLAGATTDFDRQVEAARFIREIVEHHVATEQFLHPLIRHTLPDGDAISERQFAEHRAVEEQLRRLEHTAAASAEFLDLVGLIATRWRANGRYLDGQVLPALRRGVDQALLTRLGALALNAEFLGPTRPRTLAVQEHVANTLLSDLQGLVDKTIDAFTHRGHEGSDELDALLRAGHYDGLEDSS